MVRFDINMEIPVFICSLLRTGIFMKCPHNERKQICSDAGELLNCFMQDY